MVKSWAVVCVAGTVLVVAVVGDVATLIYGHCCSGMPVMAVGGRWPAWTPMLVSGGWLASCLLLFAVACVLPEQTAFLCKAWFAVHVTYADDWGNPALAVMHDLQVTPLVDALGLTALTASVNDAKYCWWVLQGFFMMGVVYLAALFGSNEEDEEEGEEEEDPEMELTDDHRHQSHWSGSGAVPAGTVSCPDQPVRTLNEQSQH